MKTTILFCITLLFSVPIFGQEKEKTKQPFPFDEFSISVNRTNIAMFSGYENRFGCGAGMYHSSELSKQWNYMYGLEYNYTSLFEDQISDMATHRVEKNITFHIHTVSLMPLAFRFNMGKNIKYFIESGLFFGISVAGKKGEAYINHQPTDIKGDIGLSGGPSFGVGMRIPMNRMEWIVKTDYKAGLDGINGIYQYYRLGVGIRKRK